MRPRLQPTWRTAALVALVALLHGLSCRNDVAPSQEEPAPASVDRSSKEADFATIELSEAAERRLAITTEAVTKKVLSRVRNFSGEIVPPPTALVQVTAPNGGVVRPPKKTFVPDAGAFIEAGSIVLTLELTPAERTRIGDSAVAIAAVRSEASGALDRSRAEQTAAEIRFNREQRLLDAGVGTQQDLDDARARLDLAKASVKEARARVAAIGGIGADPGGSEPLEVAAPTNGTLHRVHVLAGQTVSAAAPLFEILADGPLWVRVPLYVGDLPTLRQGDVRLRAVGATAVDRSLDVVATAVPAPSAADPRTSTVDRFFELRKEDASAFQIGERVTVAIASHTEAETLTVPSAAVVYDYHGGAWVYEARPRRVYTRRRVEVAFVLGQEAALASGPLEGTAVVVHGAAELFGTELGIGR